jgi:hypothetical protein
MGVMPVSHLNEVIEQQQSRFRRTPPETRKDKRAKRRGRSRPGGFSVSCGCRFVRAGDAWRHICPCRSHKLGSPLTDAEMKFLLEEE